MEGLSACIGIDVRVACTTVLLYGVGVITEGKGSKEGEGTGDCGHDCEAESESHGTANLFRCTLSDVVKSLSRKCLLHKYLLCSLLAESIVQDIPTFPAHTAALLK